MQKTIMFDLDGTLIDSTDAILAGFDAAFEALGEEKKDHELIKPLIGHTLEDMFASLGAKSDLSKLKLAYMQHYHKIYLEQTSLLPFAKEALINASSFAKLCVVTTKAHNPAKILLNHLGVLKYFCAIIGRDDVKCVKPNPEPILLALNLCKGDKKSSFMIGDTMLDMMAAKSAGVWGLGVSCGYDKTLSKQNINLFSCANKAVSYIKSFKIINSKHSERNFL